MLVAVMAAFFYFKIDVPVWLAYPFFAVFFVSFLFDAKITARYSGLIQKHETNHLFAFLHRVAGKGAFALQFCIEAAAIAAVTFVLAQTVTLKDASVVALAFAVSHFVAYMGNRKFAEVRSLV